MIVNQVIHLFTSLKHSLGTYFTSIYKFSLDFIEKPFDLFLLSTFPEGTSAKAIDEEKENGELNNIPMGIESTGRSIGMLSIR